MIYFALGRYAEALAAYQQAIQLDPKYFAPHHGLADVFIHFKRLDEAILELQERIRFGLSNTFTPLVTLGVITYHPGLGEDHKNFVDALAQWETACRLTWQLPAGLFENRAFALLCLGQKDEALAAIQVAIAKMLPGDTIDFDLFDLLETAPLLQMGWPRWSRCSRKPRGRRNLNTPDPHTPAVRG